MTEDELIEQLADKEHDSWARWMRYLFDACGIQEDGSVHISESLVSHWQHQINTPYKELTHHEQESDREELAHILPIIEKYASEAIIAVLDISLKD